MKPAGFRKKCGRRSVRLLNRAAMDFGGSAAIRKRKSARLLDETGLIFRLTPWGFEPQFSD